MSGPDELVDGHNMWSWDCEVPTEHRPNGDGRDAEAVCPVCAPTPPVEGARPEVCPDPIVTPDPMSTCSVARFGKPHAWTTGAFYWPLASTNANLYVGDEYVMCSACGQIERDTPTAAPEGAEEGAAGAVEGLAARILAQRDLLPSASRNKGFSFKRDDAEELERAVLASDWLADRLAAAERAAEVRAWDEGKAAGLREGKVVTPFHDRFRSVNPYRARATEAGGEQ